LKVDATCLREENKIQIGHLIRFWNSYPGGNDRKGRK